MEPEYFLLNITGQIENGDGWEEGISQISTKRVIDDSFVFTWNLPIDISFRSTNIYGWPQLTICVYGLDLFGNDVIRGYGATHLPLVPGSHRKTFAVVVPSSSSLLQRISSWITGRRPEFTDPKMIAQGEGRDVVRVSSQGFVTSRFNVITKRVDAMGYRVRTGT